jgi:hypothetical protein
MITTQISVGDDRSSALSSSAIETAVGTMWLETGVSCYKAQLPRLPVNSEYSFLVSIVEA